MSMTVKDVQAWLSTLDQEDEVGVDEGGLTLQSVNDYEAYLEVGGLPEEDE